MYGYRALLAQRQNPVLEYVILSLRAIEKITTILTLLQSLGLSNYIVFQLRHVYRDIPASGGLGGATLDLLGIVDPQHVTLITTRPERLRTQQEDGAIVRKADFESSFEGVFQGVRTSNLISYPGTQVEHRFNVSPRLNSSLKRD